jgi:ribonuclease P protein component
MLAAAQRLRRRGEFAATIHGGRRVGRGAVVVHLISPDTVEKSRAPRAGFVVSKAVGSAVVRNRVKRRLRHLVKERLMLLPPGTDLVVRAQPSAADRAYPQLAADLDAALSCALAASPKPARSSSARAAKPSTPRRGGRRGAPR